MANRAAFEIDLPVEELKSFIDDYKGFKEALKQQPDEWAVVGDAISDLLEPIDKIIGAVSGIGAASAASMEHSAAILELINRRQIMTQEQTNLILLQRQDLEERIAKRKADQQKKDEEAAKKQKGSWDIFATTAGKSAKLFTQMDNATAKLFLNLRDGTTELLKWTGILTGVGGLITGLLGIGGLFGLTHLANNVSNSSMDARGMGVSIGEEKAFQTNYSHTLDNPTGFLQNISNIKNDPTQWQFLRQFGMSAQDIQKKDAGQMAPELIKNLKEMWDRSHHNWNTMKSLGADKLGISESDMVRIAGTTDQELDNKETQYKKDIPAMNIDPNTASAWTKFTEALTRAGNILETDFIKAITPLIPPLTSLSADFVNLVQTLLQLPEIKAGLLTFDTWMKEFNAFLGSDKFQKDMTAWEADVKSALDKIGAFLKSQEFQNDIKDWEADLKAVFGGIKDIFDAFRNALTPNGVKGKWTGLPYLSPYVADNPADQAKVPLIFDSPHDAVRKLFPGGTGLPGPAAPGSDPSADGLIQLNSYDPTRNGIPRSLISNASYDTGGDDDGTAWSMPRPYWAPPAAGPSAGTGSPAPSGGAPGSFGGPDGFGSLESQYGLPQGFLARIRQVESGGNDSAVSVAGAQGAFQMMPGTQLQYGVTNPNDIRQEAPAAAKMFSDLLTQFQGNLREATAAYNWGAGNVAKDVAQNGSDWESHIPQETANYLASIFGGQAQRGMPDNSRHPSRVNISVENRTGGSAIVTTRAVAI